MEGEKILAAIIALLTGVFGKDLWNYVTNKGKVKAKETNTFNSYLVDTEKRLNRELKEERKLKHDMASDYHAAKLRILELEMQAEDKDELIKRLVLEVNSLRKS